MQQKRAAVGTERKPKPLSLGFPGGTSGKEPACQRGRRKRHGFSHWAGKICGRRAWQPLHFSCLENSTDRGAWQAIVHRVAESWT